MKRNNRVGLALFLAMGLLVAGTVGCGSDDSVSASIDAGGASGDKTSTSTAAATLPASDSGQTATVDNAIVVFKTSLGTFKIQLDPAASPRTVDNFLRNYVDTKHYAGTVFHYVEKGGFIVGGGFTADFQEKQTRGRIANEASAERKNIRGTIAMARAPDDVHGATCQFFINTTDNPDLDYQEGQSAGYCVFGDVVEGLDVVDKISHVAVGNKADFPGSPAEAVVIQSVERE